MLPENRVYRIKLLKGGELILEMGPEPLIDETRESIPPSMSTLWEE